MKCRWDILLSGRKIHEVVDLIILFACYLQGCRIVVLEGRYWQLDKSLDPNRTAALVLLSC